MLPNKLLIGTNTKMYKSIEDTVNYINELVSLTADIESELELFVIPSFTALDRVNQQKIARHLKIGAQNMNWEAQGQFTGEISPVMLQEVNVDIVEIGHSERRHVLHETNDEIARKVKSALNHGFIALLCIGETEAEKTSGMANDVLSIQIKSALKDVPPEHLSRLWIAYEPVWAIGVNGKPASTEYAQTRHAFIRKVMNNLYGASGTQVPLLYGGSVNRQNASDLIMQNDIDGLFIGRSAWDAKNFNLIIRDLLS